MKIFLDTANLENIKKWMATGLVDGITTNPSHLSKEGGDTKKLILDICNTVKNGPVSVEVTETEPDAVYAQAREIAKIASNVVVKIPCHRDYYPVIKRLVDDGVPLNITLVFTVVQGLMMCKLGVRYISPFVGRWDDIDVDGSQVLYEMRAVIDQYDFSTQILAASLRHVRHLHEALLAGADIATVPVDVLSKATENLLTDQGMAKFNADWQKLGIRKFP
jgi:transaldolase